MLIKDSEALERLGSRENLMNRLRSNPNSYSNNNHSNNKNKAMSLFVPGKSASVSQEINNPFLAPQEDNNQEPLGQSEAAVIPETINEVKTDDIIDNADVKIQLSQAHDRALQLLNKSINALEAKIDDVPASKLPGVITATSKVVEGIRKERNEISKSKQGRDVHLHFYTPVQKQLESYEVIDV